MTLAVFPSLAFGNTVSESQQEWIQRFGLKVSRHIPDFEKILLNTEPEPTIGESFEELYNGKDLTGWRITANHCE